MKNLYLKDFLTFIFNHILESSLLVLEIVCEAWFFVCSVLVYTLIYHPDSLLCFLVCTFLYFCVSSTYSWFSGSWLSPSPSHTRTRGTPVGHVLFSCTLPSSTATPPHRVLDPPGIEPSWAAAETEKWQEEAEGQSLGGTSLCSLEVEIHDKDG